ncbi:MAG: trkA [Gammaproteobacteria bacterium]|jgi:trk system potassium uptake protein TrkA|nr:trkA [Gammaproteobacteria bacterium]
MKIIILGAGQVGGTLAENLALEDNDVTIVDVDSLRLRELQNRLDVRTIVGSGSYPSVLQQAGAEDADMLIAVTNIDETNMLACQIAYTLFSTPTKIARIRGRSYLAHPELFNNNNIPIDVRISPEHLVTNYVERLIEYPGALQVLDFAEGAVQMVAVNPQQNGSFVGKSLKFISTQVPHNQVHIAAIYRDNQSISLIGDTTIQAGDEVFFIAPRQHIRDIMAGFRNLDTPYRRIIIAGGGNIGYCLALALKEHFNVKVIEHNAKRTQELAAELDGVTVLLGDVSDRNLLIDENIDATDIFCSVTNDDEANIMSAMLAKRLGAKTVMALITRTAYVDLIEGSSVDIVVSPQHATIGSILTHLRRGDIVCVHSLRRGAAEAIEAIAHGDRRTSRLVGRLLNEIHLPKGVRVGAIVRDGHVIIARKDLMIEAEDHFILFLDDKKRINEVENLFQVDVGYF